MQRLTVDYGIDLGTTNSVIAVRESDRVAVIPNKSQAVVTPSAIYIDKRGQVYVGEAARVKALEDPDNVAAVFKRTMGQGGDAAKRFAASRKVMLPEELSAEILMSLRRDVRDKRGEEIRDIVITVPADFDTAQSQATKKAAELAGFRTSTLLLEPIAAALAYGFDKLDRDAYWLIYDFGGGTFDAAVVQVDDGVPKIVNHAGNNYLGGTNIDLDLVEKKLVPALCGKFNLPHYEPSTPFWRVIRAKLRFNAEIAKVEICRTKRPFNVYVETLCSDQGGQSIDFEYTLTPHDVEDATGPYLAQTLELCRRALAEKGIEASYVDRVIMVGGSTLSPWVRDAVKAELGRPLEVSIDPMTVVAEGAAVLASTIKLPPPSKEEVPVGSYRLDIKSPLTVDESPADFAAIILAPTGGRLDGLTFEAIDERSQWHTGRVQVRDGGRVNTTFRLPDESDTVFAVELRAADGTLLPCAPDRIPIHWGIGAFEIPLTHNVGVGMANNKMDVILKRGEPLPRNGRSVHRTTKTLLRGANSEPLTIPFYEGPNLDRADRNRLVWKLQIFGDRLTRDMPAGSEVEIYLSCDRSRTFTVKAEFPAFELAAEARVEYEKTMPAVEDSRKGLEAQEGRAAELRRSAAKIGTSAADSILRKIESQDFPRRITGCLRDPNDADARGNAERALRDFATALDELEDVLSFPERVSEAKSAVESLRARVAQSGKPGDRRLLEQIEADVERAIAEESAIGLRNCQAEMSQLFAATIENDIRFWIGFFAYLEQQKNAMKDSNMANMLLRQAHQAIERNDLDALKAACRQLGGLLPDNAPIPSAFGFGPTGHTQR
jgi:molecular chaperone DnaK